MTMGSLFDGLGGFPLAGQRYGIKALWASEIEIFPIAVTKIRFPDMQHMGDITKLKGADLPPVDIICGGSPCQDVSQAGRRAGLAGARSGLFFEQIRLIKEMRDADRKRGRAAEFVRPKYFLWENVPGAFSSGTQYGEDFRVVLEEICSVATEGLFIPRPPRGKWESAGAILGEEFSLAWRVVDAQYWFVPQRRKRIFLVADFGGASAPQILFEQERLLGDFTPRQTQGKIAPTNARTSAEDTGGSVIFACNQRDEVRDLHNISAAICAQQGMKQQTFVAAFSHSAGKTRDIGYAHERSPTLTHNTPSVLCINDQGGDVMDVSENITGTLRAQMHNHQPLVMATQQGGAEICEGLCPTITASAGMAGSNTPMLFSNHALDSRYTGPHDVAPTVTSSFGSGGNNVSLAIDSQETETYAIAGNIIGRKIKNGGNGLGFQKGISYTLTATDNHCVFAANESLESYQDVVGALCRGDEKGIGNQYVSQDKCIVNKNTIRRLTPLECEKLMNYPEGWTDIPTASDSKRYKALGNSVVVSCVEYVLRGIAYSLTQMKDGDQ